MMAAVRHIGFVGEPWDHPQRLIRVQLDGLMPLLAACHSCTVVLLTDYLCVAFTVAYPNKVLSLPVLQ